MRRAATAPGAATEESARDADTADARAADAAQTTRFRPPSRVDVVQRLDSAALLPAIVFVFSRAGCDAAVGRLSRRG